MLQITIPAAELWDEQKQEFSMAKEVRLQLEHSLVSISKWESKWCKPFLLSGDKPIVETLDYVRCMTLTQNVPDDAYNRFTNANIQQIISYIDAPMTAVRFSEKKGKRSNEPITAETIYYRMITLGIPFECQKWHLNRLLALIDVCVAKSEPPKKMSKREIMKRNAALNAARRKKLNSKG